MRVVSPFREFCMVGISSRNFLWTYNNLFGRHIVEKWQPTRYTTQLFEHLDVEVYHLIIQVDLLDQHHGIVEREKWKLYKGQWQAKQQLTHFSKTLEDLPLLHFHASSRESKLFDLWSDITTLQSLLTRMILPVTIGGLEESETVFRWGALVLVVQVERNNICC